MRGVVDGTQAVQERRMYAPYGEPYDGVGTSQTVYGFTGEPTDANEFVYLRARYLSPGLGVFASLDPWEGIEDTPMTLNGYAYVSGNPINFVDPTGECDQPTNWSNPFDVNCYYSAVGLAQRFSNGDAAAYQAWFNVLIQKPWYELKALEATGTAADVTGASRQFVDNAAIIPRLFRENPQAALEALQQFSCQNRGTILGFTSTLVIASAQMAAQSGLFGSGSAVTGAGVVGGTGGGFSAGGIGIAIVGGIAIAVGAVVAWDELTRPNEFASFDYDAARLAATEEIARRLANPIILVRGTALSRVHEHEGLYDNRLWVFRESHFFEAVGYAKRDALLNNDTAAVSVYGMIERVFDNLISSGNIRTRFGIEYGLDAVAQAFLVGPVVIPIPDMRHG